jgi:hypothetical protein
MNRQIGDTFAAVPGDSLENILGLRLPGCNLVVISRCVYRTHENRISFIGQTLPHTFVPLFKRSYMFRSNDSHHRGTNIKSHSKLQ